MARHPCILFQDVDRVVRFKGLCAAVSNWYPGNLANSGAEPVGIIIQSQLSGKGKGEALTSGGPLTAIYETENLERQVLASVNDGESKRPF